MDEIREKIRSLGFVRVDGLIAETVDGRRTQIQRQPGKNWRIWGNNGIVAVSSPSGEVWIGLQKSVGDTGPLISEGVVQADGFFVPCSNGESLNAWDLYRRMRNPDWIPDYVYSELRWRP